MSDELANAIVKASESMKERDAVSLAATVYLEKYPKFTPKFKICTVDERIPDEISRKEYSYFEHALKALRQHNCVPMMGDLEKEHFALVDKAYKVYNKKSSEHNQRNVVAVFHFAVDII